MARFADVILPLPLRASFTYSVSVEDECRIDVGSRVFVQFGRKNYYTGIVEMLHNNKPEGYEVKEIMLVLDDNPIVRYPQLKFWNWISEYYLCAAGDVYKAAVPAGLKIESETYVSLNPDYEADENSRLTERMAMIVQLLDVNRRMRPIDIEKELGFRNVGQIVSKMLDLNVLVVDERIVDKYRSRKETMVRLNCDREDSEILHTYFDLVRKSHNQERLLISYLELSDWMQTNLPLKEVLKKDLLDKSYASSAVLKAMISKGIFEIYKKEINRFMLFSPEKSNMPVLSEKQNEAYRSILQSWKTQNITLLRGVTGSGKTEIYSHLIDATLQKGEQVLYLVPEISLTTQLTDRLQRIFGGKLLIYHSKFSDNERVDVWKKLLGTNEPLIVLGVRSSVFLPFAKLGLVVVDEEHESSYKQYDPAPRYNARDAAIVLASMHGAKTLLGSATPSVETYFKATNGKYGLVELLDRYEGVQLPDVEVIDMREQRKKKLNNGIFSMPLLEESRSALESGKQVIMFQNRRGFAPMLLCKECGWIPKCVNCDVSLVYHKHTGEMKCHYCGYSMTMPTICPACGLNGVEICGYGTERIAEDLDSVFPEHRISRMDLDTTRNKDGYEVIIEEFSSHKTDILVGTQMVSKGLDFESVKAVGVLNADTILNFPDFRSNERAFNMLEQVAGRAGRKHEKGKVIIQTVNPSNNILQYVCKHDYIGYYSAELEDRREFGYPPFTKVVNIVLKHKEQKVLGEVAIKYVNLLRSVFGNRILGPVKPPVSRISTYYIETIMLKVEANASMRKVKELLRNIYEQMCNDSRMRSVVVNYDVDPV